MAVCQLSMTKDYVPDWGIWEGLREFMQNALDGDDEGFEMEVEYSCGAVIIRNKDADVGLKSFLLGSSGKRGKDLRGKHGEGLAVAMLALTRAGVAVNIVTRYESWRPEFRYAPEYEDEVLTIITEPPTDMYSGIEVWIRISEEDWDVHRKRFIRFLQVPENTVFKGNSGTMYTDPCMKGRIYSKGIFVQTRTDLQYGYDLNNIKLDRDRNTVPDFDLKWEIGTLVGQLTGKREEPLPGSVAYKMLMEDNEDLRFSDSTAGQQFGKSMFDHFIESEGKSAVPVTSTESFSKMRSIGKTPVVVPPRMRDVLIRGGAPRAEDLSAKADREVTEIFDDSDLGRFEYSQMVLLRDRMAGMKCSVFPRDGDRDSFAFLKFIPDADTLKACEMAGCEGRFSVDEGNKRVLIVKKSLEDDVTAMSALVGALEELIRPLAREEDMEFSRDLLWLSLYYSQR